MSVSFYVVVLFSVLANVKTSSSQVLCYTTTVCSNSNIPASSISDCCAQTQALSFVPSVGAEQCILCFVYGWVKDISADRSSAKPQETITAVEGQVVPLNIFFTKNGNRNNVNYAFEIVTSGSAIESTDYELEPGSLQLNSSNIPIPVNISLKNDQLRGEVENITLTLRNVLNVESNEILLHDTVTINILDNSIATGFPQREVSIKEDQEAEVCLKTEGSPTANIYISVFIDTSTAYEEDISLQSDELIITPSEPEPCVKFSATAGDSDDLNMIETLSLVLIVPDNVILDIGSITVFIEDVSNGVEGKFMCSKQSDCSGSFVSNNVSECCMTESGLSYQNSSGTCSKCNERSNQEETNDENNSSNLTIFLPVVLMGLLLPSVAARIIIGCYLIQNQNNKKNKVAQQLNDK